MGYFPDVSKGEPVKHNAVLENNLRHMVNALNGFGDHAPKAGSSGVVRVQVWNATDGTLLAGCPVAFADDKNLVDGALPAVKVADPAKPFGVLVCNLDKNSMGDCIVSGPARIEIAGGSGEYAVPISNGSSFRLSGTGTARVLWEGNGKAIVLLGAGGASDFYEGPFAIKYDSEQSKVAINPGYISTNGLFSVVPAALLEPQTGIVCVYSEIGLDGIWSTPEIRYATPDKYNFPIGSVTVSGSGESISVSVQCYRVPVAMIIDTAECPISAEADAEGGNDA